MLFTIISAFVVLFLSPGEHVFLNLVVKYIPLMLIFLGSLVRFIFFIQVNSFFMFYVFFWNPMIHKFIVFFSGLFMNLVKFFDFVYIELIGPYRLSKFLVILFFLYRVFGFCYFFVFM